MSERCEDRSELAQLPGIAARQNEPRHGSECVSAREGLRLQREQLAEPGRREIEERVELIATERVTFRRALDLDERAAAVHHDVHVGLGLRVFGVIEIE